MPTGVLAPVYSGLPIRDSPPSGECLLPPRFSSDPTVLFRLTNSVCRPVNSPVRPPVLNRINPDNSATLPVKIPASPRVVPVHRLPQVLHATRLPSFGWKLFCKNLCKKTWGALTLVPANAANNATCRPEAKPPAPMSVKMPARKTALSRRVSSECQRQKYFQVESCTSAAGDCSCQSDFYSCGTNQCCRRRRRRL